MYIAALISLLSGILFSGVFLNGFELVLSNVFVPVINWIKRNNNNPYKIKIVHYVDDENITENNNETDINIDRLITKINSVNTKSDSIYVDDKLD